MAAYKSELQDIDLDNISFESHVKGHKMEQPEKIAATRQNSFVAFNQKDDFYESDDEAADQGRTVK